MESLQQRENTVEAKRLKRKFTGALLALLITFLAVASATYAWYIYNTSQHTTNVRMAAGAGVNLQISNAYNGVYGSSAVLESFSGQLVPTRRSSDLPVSTNKISAGFQKVTEFASGYQTKTGLAASIFGNGEQNDYYHTSLFLRTTGGTLDIYLSDIGFEDSDEASPISSAIRLGLVVHKVGEHQAPDNEYIFSISDKKNPEAEYNTATGQEGYVLDASRKDGTTVPFTPYTSDEYCIYNKETGAVKRKDDSLRLCTISGADDGSVGESVEIELYIWLEGCDEDCTSNLCRQTLRNLAVSFAGVKTDQ